MSYGITPKQLAGASAAQCAIMNGIATLRRSIRSRWLVIKNQWLQIVFTSQKESITLQTNPQIKQLYQAVSEFKKCIQDLPYSKFLQPIHEWTPRDVLAHLIGWNWLYITGLQEIKSGVEPSYFKDTYNDYRNVNAKSLELYNQSDQGLLIDELEDSFQALQNYLISLNSDDWKTDFGVSYRGSTTTIGEEVAELIQDYDDHREEIQAWMKFQEDH